MGIFSRPAHYTKNVALVLQGGGALGSYQGGVYQALAESEYQPDWVAGISIGAINAALIAGNAADRRVDRLREFWESVTTPTGLFDQIPAVGKNLGVSATIARQASAMHALIWGQPSFFQPWRPIDWWFGRAPISYYDTSALKSTLERLVDFDRINAGETRFSVGAVNIETGNLVYFDNTEIEIRPEHVMASGALPPGFSPVEIDGEYYWDGGLVSNTPLKYVIEYFPRRSHLIFQVDVFPAHGPMPGTLSEVSEREKDIRYSSRTRAATETLKRLHDLRHGVNMLWEKLPDHLRNGPEAQLLNDFRCVTTMDIVELIYCPETPQDQSKGYQFDRPTMRTRWAQGLADATATLMAAPWLEPMPAAAGARTFDFRAGSADPGASRGRPRESEGIETVRD